MRRRVRVRPPRWIYGFVCAMSIVSIVVILVMFRGMGAHFGSAWLLFLMPPVLVGLVGLIGFLRGGLPIAYCDVEFDDAEGPARDASDDPA